MASAGWYPDPLGRAQVRYFDGTAWSQWAADDGKSRLDAEAVLTALPEPPAAPPPGIPPPPGTGWLPATAGPATAQRFRSIKGLSAALTWVTAISIVSVLAVAGALIYRIGVADTFFTSNPSNFASAYQDLQDADDAVSSTTTIFLFLAIAIFVLLIVFMFRAAKNNELWNSQRATWVPGWTIGGWFIPVAWWVIPFLVFREIWLRSLPEGAPKKLPALVWVWWILYVAGSLAIAIDPDTSTFDDLRLRDGANAAGFVALGVSALLLILAVRRLTAAQHARANSIGQ